MLNKILTKDFLIENHLNQKKSSKEIAKMVGCDSSTIGRYLKFYQLPVFNWYSKKLEKILTKEYLIEKYVLDLIPCSEIAKQTGCDSGVVSRYLKKYKIPIKERHSAYLDRLFTKEFLQVIYINKKFSIKKISAEFGCSQYAVSKYLKKYGMPIRNISESKKGVLLGPQSEEHRKNISKGCSNRKGENGCNYKDGRTSLRVRMYSLSEYLNWKNRILKRDGRMCQKCGGSQELEVHHIKENYLIFEEFLKLYPQYSPKKDSDKLLQLARKYTPFWDIDNGTTLCYDCHDLVEKNKKKKLCLL
jgi:predicted transcriptional regulator